MRWENERESSNIEDRRGGSGGGGGGLPFLGGGRLSLGTVAVILIGGWLLGINPLTLLGLLSGADIGTTVQQQSYAPSTGQKAKGQQGINDEGKRFVSVVLASTEDVWEQVFRANGARYTPPGLVLFNGRTPPPAARVKPVPVPSTARPTARSTSIWPSTTSCATS